MNNSRQSFIFDSGSFLPSLHLNLSFRFAPVSDVLPPPPVERRPHPDFLCFFIFLMKNCVYTPLPFFYIYPQFQIPRNNPGLCHFTHSLMAEHLKKESVALLKFILFCLFFVA